MFTCAQRELTSAHLYTNGSNRYTAPCACGEVPFSADSAVAHAVTCSTTYIPVIPDVSGGHGEAAAAAAAAITGGPRPEVCVFCDRCIGLVDPDEPAYRFVHGGLAVPDDLAHLLSPPPDLCAELCEYYTVSADSAGGASSVGVHSSWETLLLSRSPEAIADPLGFHSCVSCARAVNAGPAVLPSGAVARGYFMGAAAHFIEKTPELRGLSETEWNLSSLAPSRNVYRSFWRTAMGASPDLVRREGFSGHALYADGDPACIAAYMKKLPAVGNGASVIVHLTGSMTSAEKALRCRSVRVRRQGVIDLVRWNRKHNVLHAGVPVDNVLMSSLPYEGYMPGSVVHSGAVVASDDLPSPEVLTPVAEMAGTLTSSVDGRVLSDRLGEASRNMHVPSLADDDMEASDVEDASSTAPLSDPVAPDASSVAPSSPALDLGPTPVCSVCAQPAGARVSDAHAWLCSNTQCMMYGLNALPSGRDSSGNAPPPGSHRAQYNLGVYTKLWRKDNWPKMFPSIFLFGRGGPNEPGLVGVSLKAWVSALCLCPIQLSINWRTCANTRAHTLYQDAQNLHYPHLYERCPSLYTLRMQVPQALLAALPPHIPKERGIRPYGV